MKLKTLSAWLIKAKDRSIDLFCNFCERINEEIETY